MAKAVSVFCGSRTGTPIDYRGLAAATGDRLARAGWRIVYGGGDVGLMGAVADAAIAADGEVRGFIPERLLDREVGHRGITDLSITPDMFERKRLMIGGSDAFLALPGGLGTLDEILDVVTLRQLGYHDRPIILVDVDGFWQPFRALVEHVTVTGFAAPDVLDLYTLAPDLDAALAALGPA
ncbi:MAG: TIGR00730 family Rossman fold protein [Geminicoccaceae bacterium]|nr:MAG: TIGR00730 family Rossman fold protein [Geminicoccaceae bacterium]